MLSSTGAKAVNILAKLQQLTSSVHS